MEKKWIKFWYSTLGDPVLAGLKPAERWTWFCIIAISSKGKIEGTLDPEMTDKYIANEAHLDIKLVAKVMQKVGGKVTVLLDNSREINNYSKYQSDWSRLRKYDSQHKKRNESYNKHTENIHSDKEVRSKKKEVDVNKERTPPLQVIDYLNKVKGTNYQAETWRVKINSILKRYTVDDCKLLIDHQATLRDEVDKKFFVPATIFRNMINFEERLMKARYYKSGKGVKKYDAITERSRKRSLEKRHT